jgi:hypothetical protein
MIACLNTRSRSIVGARKNRALPGLRFVDGETAKNDAWTHASADETNRAIHQSIKIDVLENDDRIAIKKRAISSIKRLPEVRVLIILIRSAPSQHDLNR